MKLGSLICRKINNSRTLGASILSRKNFCEERRFANANEEITLPSPRANFPINFTKPITSYLPIKFDIEDIIPCNTREEYIPKSEEAERAPCVDETDFPKDYSLSRNVTLEFLIPPNTTRLLSRNTVISFEINRSQIQKNSENEPPASKCHDCISQSSKRSRGPRREARSGDEQPSLPQKNIKKKKRKKYSPRRSHAESPARASTKTSECDSKGTHSLIFSSSMVDPKVERQ
ncbi:hypothetical protein PUN28_014310 [Cardiocondyla obscurior]|uniref:Uncharacterized protein n=1 Tax=Cardiocondyla obscurior TaxID=286306 RepID=A0AAW2EZE9_9HYME